MNNKCSFSYPGTFGHECGRPASYVRITVMPKGAKEALQCMGASVPEDGLFRSFRCSDHKGLSEFGDGDFVALIPVNAIDYSDGLS